MTNQMRLLSVNLSSSPRRKPTFIAYVVAASDDVELPDAIEDKEFFVVFRTIQDMFDGFVNKDETIMCSTVTDRQYHKWRASHVWIHLTNICDDYRWVMWIQSDDKKRRDAIINRFDEYVKSLQRSMSQKGGSSPA